MNISDPHATPVLKPVADKAVYRHITSFVQLNPALMKPVTPEEMEVSEEMMQQVMESANVTDSAERAEVRSLQVEIECERRESLRPEAEVFVPGSGLDTSEEPTGPKEVASSLSKPIHGLPERPTLCAMQPNLPRWAHSPSHAALGSIAPEYVGAGTEERRASVMASYWRASISKDDNKGLVGVGAEGGRRGSQSMTPWARKHSVPDSHQNNDKASNSKAINEYLHSDPTATRQPNFTAFSFGSKNNSFMSVSPRQMPLAGGSGGFSSFDGRVPGSLSSSRAYEMGSYGAGGAVKVPPRRPTVGVVFAQVESTGLLGAVPMQGAGAYK